MCTLIVFHQCFARAGLLVAANRDEYLERPAEPPTLRQFGTQRGLAPRDARAGGTWLGVNQAGVFAALTNRPNPRPDPARRSRGLLVADVLAAGSAVEAAARLGTLAADAYNPFNLFVCDGHDAFVAIYEEKPEIRRLTPGPHVIGNGDPDDRSRPKLARLLDEAEVIARAPASEALPALARVCATHVGDANPLESTCIHAGGYGTRSSTLLRRGTPPGEEVFRFASGPPCSHAYQDYSPLLAQLDPAGMRAGASERKHA
jgi:uncharacterized protein with NRDE domain